MSVGVASSTVRTLKRNGIPRGLKMPRWRCIALLEVYDEGEVRIEGRLLGCRERDGRRTPPSEREIDEVRGSVGMVFQHLILWPYMTALGNVTEALRMVKRMSRRDAEESGLDVLRRVGLETHAGHNPEQLYDGRIVEQDPPAQLFAAPQSERLRAFLNTWRERSI